MGRKGYYEIPGVNRNADENTIKKAYWNLAMKYHPDHNPGRENSMMCMAQLVLEISLAAHLPGLALKK